MVEYANGLVMLEGDKRMKESPRSSMPRRPPAPADAMERLDVEMAKADGWCEEAGEKVLTASRSPVTAG
jgi:hypothetical protein